MHIRGGSVIPLQEPDEVTAKARTKPFGLLYALPESNLTSSLRGSLFWDDGEQRIIERFNMIQFAGDKSHLSGEPVGEIDIMDMPQLNNVTIYGLTDYEPTDLILRTDTTETHHAFLFDTVTGVLSVFNLNINMTMPFELVWI